MRVSNLRGRTCDKFRENCVICNQYVTRGLIAPDIINAHEMSGECSRHHKDKNAYKIIFGYLNEGGPR